MAEAPRVGVAKLIHSWMCLQESVGWINRNFSPPDVQERWFQAAGPAGTAAAQAAVHALQRRRHPLCRHLAGSRHWWRQQQQQHTGGASTASRALRQSSEQCLQLGLCIGITGWVCERPT